MNHYADPDCVEAIGPGQSYHGDLVDYFSTGNFAAGQESVFAGKRLSPLRILIIIVAITFLAEVIAMMFIYLLNPLSYLYLTLVDAAIMTLLIFPVIYFLIFRPLLSYAILSEKVARANRRSNERLRELEFIVNQSQAIVFQCVKQDGWSMEFVSENISHLGYAPDEFSAGAFKPEAFVFAEDWPALAAEVEELIAQGGGDVVKELRVRTRSGAPRWLDCHIAVRLMDDNRVPHLKGVGLDVTERKIAEEQVQLERDRLESILDVMPDGVYILNQNYEFEYVNPVIESEFGPTNGQRCYRYFHDEPAVCSWCVNDMVFSGQSVRWEHHFARNSKFYELFDTPFEMADGSLAKLQILHDITKRKENEAALRNTNKELRVLTEVERQQRQLAEISLTASVEFAQSLELQNVLNALLDYVGRLVPYDEACVSLLDAQSHLTTHMRRGEDGCKVATGLVEKTRVQSDDPILHTLLNKQKSLLIQDTSTYPGWQTNPDIEHIKSWLGVPIVANDNMIGLLELSSRKAGFFTTTHVQWSGALAGQAAIAIQNAWLFDQIRTANERLQSLSRKLVEVQESERRHIARELHDEVSQALATVLLDVSILQVDSEQPEENLIRAREIEDTLKVVLQNLHRLAKDLRPATLDHLGLEATLRQTAGAIQQKHGIQVNMQLTEIAGRLPDDFATAIYRIASEALNNVILHAHATMVDIVLSLRDNDLILVIEDNGDGFDSRSLQDTGRLGLFGMQERAEMLGGTLVIDSEEGRGTTLVAKVPYVN